MPCEDFIQAMTLAQQFAGPDFDIAGLSFDTAERLVNNHRRVWQTEALALGASRHQDRGNPHSRSYTDSRDVWLEPLHSVIDAETYIETTPGTRGVDINVNILGCVFTLEVEQHSHVGVSGQVVDSRSNENDAIFQ